VKKWLRIVSILTLSLFTYGFDGLNKGDFNGDGIPDVAMVNGFSVSLHLGHGDGTFTRSYFFFAVESPVSVTTADLNSDGRLDMAVAYTNPIGEGVQVFIGKGDGLFAGRRDNEPAGFKLYQMGSQPEQVITADLDGDGDLDLVAVNSGPGVTARLNQGNGIFPGTNVKGFRIKAANALVAGDFDNDGKVDVALARGTGVVTILRGQGDGTFVQGGEFAVGAQPAAIMKDDLNGDGHLDLITANVRSNDISVLLGQGDGSFAPAQNFAADRGAGSLTLGDFNEDGRLDVAVLNRNSISLLIGRGDGTFDPPQNLPVPSVSVAITNGDFNGDGHLDLAFAGFGLEPAVLLGDGKGGFTPVTP
jgi:hypothetical protein